MYLTFSIGLVRKFYSSSSGVCWHNMGWGCVSVLRGAAVQGTNVAHSLVATHKADAVI